MDLKVLSLLILAIMAGCSHTPPHVEARRPAAEAFVKPQKLAITFERDIEVKGKVGPVYALWSIDKDGPICEDDKCQKHLCGFLSENGEALSIPRGTILEVSSFEEDEQLSFISDEGEKFAVEFHCGDITEAKGILGVKKFYKNTLKIDVLK